MSGMTQARSSYGLQVSLVSGAGTATNIAITGIEYGSDGTIAGGADEIVAVLHFTPSAAMADLTSETAITSDGNIQLSTTATTSDQLIVLWNDLSL